MFAVLVFASVTITKSIVVPDGMCTVTFDDAVLVLGLVVCVVVRVPPLVAGGFSAGGGVVCAAGGVSSTG
jgi:hypothetical protein